MNLDQYIDNINQRYKLGNATEHTFRGDLQTLIESLVPTISATNEPKRQSCGAPDYILTKKDIPVGFIEAKDIGDRDLEGAKKTGNKEQFDRYKASLNNLIFTDYINFLLYRDGLFITKIAIAEITDKGIKPLSENFASFENLIKDFCTHIGQTIKSSKKLAEMMAGKARLLSEVIEKALTSDEEHQEDSTLKDQMMAFKQILIHDITAKGFADVYAQTICYGMFAARLHDPTLPSFSRQEAAELIPKSNPFLRKLFGYIAGPDIDDRIKWIVDSLVEIFLACNVEEILKNYGKSTKMEDPIIHFYETFLSEYDPKLRKARGVWYTPAPVVNFIVRAVDDILKTEFDLPKGLADTSKTKITLNTQSADKRSTTGYKQIEQEVHRVQILDPATGTGTFLAEVVKHIHKKFEGQQGIWSNYVENHLLPRLNGFELLMASYAMAHLKLDLLLTETGYKSTPSYGHPSNGGEFGRGGGRLRVYLTNSLEEHHPGTGTLFANWLSSEANEANHIKRDTPVMVVMGNPPYSVSSSNKSEWIEKLTADYKKDLNERNIQPLSDDYIKFIRFGQHFVDKNGSGILAYISNNSFIDGIIHRQMRKHLLESFDSIYILDLHGNSKKKEVCPDGTPDQNVFDIMQGVSINLFVKTGKKKKNELGQVFHSEIQGKRESKYDFLNENSLESIKWNDLQANVPNFFLVKKDFINDNVNLFFQVDKLFGLYNSGLTTEFDELAIQETLKNSTVLLDNLKTKNCQEIESIYQLGQKKLDKISNAIKDVNLNKSTIKTIYYRPFDHRFTIYTGKTNGIMGRPRNDLMKHFFNVNLGLIVGRQGQAVGSMPWNVLTITNTIVDSNIFYRGRGTVFPLYLYPEPSAQQTIEPAATRTPNLNAEIVKQIAEKIGLGFVPEKNSPPLEGCPKGGVVNSVGVGNSTNAKDIVTYISNTPIKRNFVENLPHNPALNKLARDKRKAGILSEVLFWQQVHQGKFHNIDFDRQRIIGSYIVDFYVKTLGLVIEIDGSSHDDKIEYDAQRQQYLESSGLRVYRISDGDVKMNLGIVMLELENYIVSEYGVQTILVNEGELTTPPVGHPSKGGEGGFAPIDILDYIYAVLHSPTYREKYKEFLKIDFPRVPYPKDADMFWQLVKLGGEIRQLHLLESPTVENYITQYPVDGNNVVDKIRFETYDYTNEIPDENGIITYPDYLGAVYINENQYFADVPSSAWNFYIGGYQPAQKWLKDRKGRKLEFDDILHYQEIIVALSETNRLMKEIDRIAIE
ncbi:MAG: type ISP restriction/modification enzyme [Bacteroidota bacterium]|nr:type ISP restriction/modification enzyme [Bacteroidota bacterium]